MRPVVSQTLTPFALFVQLGELLISSWLVITSARAQPATPTQHRAQAIISLLAMLGPGQPDSTRLLPRLDSARQQATNQHDSYLAQYCQLLSLRCRLAYRTRRVDGSQHLLAGQARLLNSRFPAIRAGYWHAYGAYLLEQRQFEESFRFLFRAQQQFERIGWAHLPQAIDYLYDMGSLYFRFGDYARAIYYLALAERYRPAQPLRLRTVVLNTLGLAYQKQSNYSQARRSFQTALRQAQLTGDSAYQGIVSGNLGNTLRLEGQLRAALPYLYQDIAISQRLVPENTATTCLYLAKVLLALDSTTKARRYIDYSGRLAIGHPIRGIYRLNYSEVRGQYAQKTGDLRAALRWADSAYRLRDSLRSAFNGSLLLATEHRLQAEQYLVSLHTLESQRSHAERLRNGSLVALVLLSLAGWYALRQKTNQQRQQQQFAAERLAAASEQLAQYVESLQAKNEWITQMTDQLTQVRQTSSFDASAEAELSVQALLKSVILTEQDWQQFRTLFERVHPGFFARLSQQALTPAEVRLLALSRLGLPTKEMALMLCITPEAIRKGRYRLRKKLSAAPPDSTLAELLAFL